ncbi:MAG: hypothetical protein JW783_05220 [Bacteroidales bacterium]|nr:hypothetical protein [Bacteroidales bacterium]MBN2749376.1 hypothetical protein [Bacteroidales bacterium]
MRFDFLNREGLYRENGELFRILVIEHIEDCWGLKLKLRHVENLFARENQEGIVVYEAKEKPPTDFTVSGAWEIVSVTNDVLSLAYTGLAISFKQPVLNAFARSETDWYSIWFATD